MKGTGLFNLTGKTAIITGGGIGLGVQIATGFVEAGVNVVLCSRKKEACDEVARKLKNLEAGRCPSSVISQIRQMYRKWLTKLTGNSVPLTF